MMAPSSSDRRNQQIFGILDIGTSKVGAAIIAAPAIDVRPRAGGWGLRFLGLGLQKSKGVKAGVLTDLDAAEDAVRAAISQAEQAAGLNISSVSVAIAAGRLGSRHFAANADIGSGVVSDGDVQRMMHGGRAFAERDGRMLIHMNRLGFRLDGTEGVLDARGLAARKLSAYLHAVTADEAPLRNLLLLIERAHLACDGLVAAPYASALAVTTEEERALGVTTIDFGAGTTTIGIFADGRFVGADVVPVGSQHITFDIAKTLQHHSLRPSESKRFMAQWSLPSLTSMKRSLIPLRAKRTARLTRRPRRGLRTSSAPALPKSSVLRASVWPRMVRAHMPAKKLS